MYTLADGNYTVANTGSFQNSSNESCEVRIDHDMVSEIEAEYNVRTSARSILRVGGSTKVVTSQTVESFGSMRQAKREYNWQLYVMQAPAHIAKLEL